MKVVWTDQAYQDRLAIWDYIVLDSPLAAAMMDELFSDASDLLADHPMSGKPGKISGTREFIAHKNYCLVYEIEEETVWILTLVHTARQWPPVTNDHS